jgi:LacI family transcriptional regulator, gluconate utilization system Gnt-I transcriptional repressor
MERKTRVKMRDVAQAAGVSAMTVSRALQQDGRVAPDTRQHVLSIIDQLGYVPDQIAASFSSQKSGFVAALVPSLNNPHFAETVRALSETLEADGIQILLGQTNYQPEREERLVQEMLQRRPEAIVLTADAHSPKTRQLLSIAGLPVVEIWDMPPDPISHMVGFSNFEAARTMVQYLASCGYRRIAYVGETHDEGMRGARRRDGFIAAMTGLGLGEARIHLQSAPPVSMMQGRAAFHAVRERWPDVDAIMCVSDPCAFGVMMEAHVNGLSVPRDLGIAGFGNFEIGRCAVPDLTTVGIDAFELGLAAAQLLKGKDRLRADAPAHVRIAFEVIARGSTHAQVQSLPAMAR